MTDLRTLAGEMRDVKGSLEEAMTEHVDRVRASAEADRVSRIAKASAYLAASGPVAERQAHVDLATSDAQYRAKLAEGLEKSALEAVRSYRQVLSSLQSLASLAKEEAALARWEPKETEAV